MGLDVFLSKYMGDELNIATAEGNSMLAAMDIYSLTGMLQRLPSNFGEIFLRKGHSALLKNRR